MTIEQLINARNQTFLDLASVGESSPDYGWIESKLIGFSIEIILGRLGEITL